MKTTVFLFICGLLLVSCSKEDSTPVTPTPPAPAKKMFGLSEYRFRLDPTYYKMWSDSVSQRYGGTTTVNGKTYDILDEGKPTKYLYTSNGEEAGFIYGPGPLIYDSPMPNLPDSVAFGSAFTLSTQYQWPVAGGTPLTIPMVAQYTLMDTGSVQVPCGAFVSCAHFAVHFSSVNVGGVPYSTDYETWFVKGLSGIKYFVSGQTNAVTVVRARVGGRSWGM